MSETLLARDPSKISTMSSANIPHNLKNSEQMAKSSGKPSHVSPLEPLTIDSSFHANSTFRSPSAFRRTEATAQYRPASLALPSPGSVVNPDGPISISPSGSPILSPNTMSSSAKSSLSTFNQGRGSGISNRSDSLDSASITLRPHTGGDGRWDAIHSASSKDSPLGLSNFRLLKRLGYGDIGSVYLVELRGTNAFFAMKVMDKSSLATRNKLIRAQTEKEILGLLDHPFLPTLYSYFETEKFYCLVMEYCSGGNLHTLRQKQPHKHFSEDAARLLPLILLILVVPSQL